MKIYIVTQGCYSDYKIVGVFKTRKLAAAYARDNATGDSYDDARVKPYDVETHYTSVPLPKGYKTYEIRMYRDGRVYEYSGRTANSEPLKEEFSEGWPRGPVLDIICRARNQTHAIKITNERRIQLIAENRWGEPLSGPGPDTPELTAVGHPEVHMPKIEVETRDGREQRCQIDDRAQEGPGEEKSKEQDDIPEIPF